MKRLLGRDAVLVVVSLSVGLLIGGVGALSAVQDLRVVADAYVTAWDTGKTDALEAHVAPGFQRHQPGPDNPTLDFDGLKTAISDVHQGYPDFAIQIDEFFSCGNYSASRYSWTGTFAATDRKVSMEGITFARYENGKLAEEWSAQNQANLLTQLGWTFTEPGG